MKKWKVVAHNVDDDIDEPKKWCLEINNKYGKFIWIFKNENEYDVVICKNNDFVKIATCKSLLSAKKCVTNYIK